MKQKPMRRLIEELKRQHPGYDIIDLRLSRRQGCESSPDEQPIDLNTLDKDLARSVRNAKEIDISKAFL